MINLKWLPFPEADVIDYRVYRSMIGFQAILVNPAAVDGMTLVLALNGTAPQTVTFSGSGPDLVTQINATLTGGRAYMSADIPNAFFVRSDVRTSPGSVEILGGTAIAGLGVTARLITERSEDTLIATVPALPDPTQTVSYTDNDGVLQDWYAISTIDHLATESLKSAYRQPVTSTGNVCVMEGTVTDLQGRRIADAEVKVTLIDYPLAPNSGTHVTLAPILTLSGPDGRYSLIVLQGAVVKLEIPVIGLTRQILVPARQFVFVTDLLADDSAAFTPDGNFGV